MSTISRRAFLKTVGVGALSIAAVSVLAGCDVAGTQTPVVDAATVEAKAGTPYQVSDMVTVNTTYNTDGKFAVKDSWGKKYVTAYKTAGSNKITSVSKYMDATQDERDAAKKAAENAVKGIEKETATVNFSVKNYGESPIVLASSTKDGKIVSDAFKATCNGAAVDCTINSNAAIIEKSSGGAVTVTCTITLPANSKSFDLTVALPGAEKVLKYTFTNKEYTDCDPTKPEFYAIA